MCLIELLQRKVFCDGIVNNGRCNSLYDFLDNWFQLQSFAFG